MLTFKEKPIIYIGFVLAAFLMCLFSACSKQEGNKYDCSPYVSISTDKTDKDDGNICMSEWCVPYIVSEKCIIDENSPLYQYLIETGRAVKGYTPYALIFEEIGSDSSDNDRYMSIVCENTYNMYNVGDTLTRIVRHKKKLPSSNLKVLRLE